MAAVNQFSQLDPVLRAINQCTTAEFSLDDVTRIVELAQFIRSQERQKPNPQPVLRIHADPERGFKRSALVEDSGTIHFLMNKRREGDQEIGRGVAKKVKHCVSANLDNPQQRVEINALYTSTVSGKHDPRVYAAARKLMNREAAMLMSFAGHERVAQVSLFYPTDRQFYMIGKKYKCDVFDHIVNNSQMTLSERLSLTQKCALALAALHESGKIHRDFKIENCLMDEEGNVVVGDLGDICGVDEEIEKRKNNTGTFAWLSPERARAALKNDPEQVGRTATIESDLYPLGVMLYTILFAQPFLYQTGPEEGRLFQAASVTADQILEPLARWIRKSKGDFGNQLREHGAEITQIIASLTNLDPSKRMSASQTAAELGKIIEKLYRS
jgi:serine/threonine protein kinase